MISFKKFLKSSVVYTVLAFLPLASRVILLPIFLLYLSPSDYGMIGLNSTLASAFPIFMTLGLDTAFSRYYFDYKRSSKLLNAYVSTIFISILIISSILIILVIPFGNNLQELLFKDHNFSFFPFGITALLYAMITSLNGILFTLYRNRQDVKSYAFFSIGLFLVMMASDIISIVILHYIPAQIVWFKIFFVLGFSFFIWLKLFSGIKIKFEKRFITNSLSYSIPLIPYMFFGFIYTSYDRVMIENKLTLGSVAIYGLAASIAFIIESIMTAIQSATFPQVYEMMKITNKENEVQVNQILRMLGIFSIGMIALICFVMPFGVFNFLKPVYLPAISILPLLLIGFCFRYMYMVYSAPLFYYKKTRLLPWLNIVAGLITIVGNLILLPLYGLYGSAVTMIAARGIQIILAFYWSKKTPFNVNLSYLNPGLLLIMISLFATCMLGKDHINSHWYVYLVNAIPLLVFISICGYRFWTKRENILKLKTLASLRELL